MFDDTDITNKTSEDPAKKCRKDAKNSKTRQSLKDRAPKCALPYASRTSAIITVCATAKGPPSKKTVKLPDELKNDAVGLAIIFGLQDKPDKSPVTAYTRMLCTEEFLLFVVDNLVVGMSPVDVMRLYRNELNNRVKQNTVRGYISDISILLRHAIETPRFMSTLDVDQQWHIRRVFASIPSVSAAPTRPRVGLGELFEDLPDDRSLFDGLRDYAAWAMLELQAHREELLCSEGVRTALAEARQLVGDDTNALTYRAKNGSVLESRNPSTLCDAVFEAVCLSDSLTLKERLLLGLGEYRAYLVGAKNNVPVTREELDVWLNRCRKSLLRKNSQSSIKRPLGFAHCDLRSLVKPTDAECICLQWLLAGVSVQSSGQQRAQVNDYVIQANSVYIRYEKQRSKRKYKDTDPISKKSDMGKAISGFIALKMREGIDDKRLLERDSYLDHLSSRSPRWRFLLSATYENSAVRKAFLERRPKGEAFLELLTQLRMHGDQYCVYKNRATALYMDYLPGDERKRKLEELKLNMPVVNIKSISCETIRRTRISLDDVTPGLSLVAREAEERANAASNGHTVDVFRTVYRNRDNSRYRLKIRAEFAAAVGELMVVLSGKIGELKKSTEVLTPENVAEAIGLETGLESEDESAARVLAALEVQGYRLNYFGAAIKGNSRIIVETPVTVALLLDAQEAYLSVGGDETATDVQVEEAALEYALIESVIDGMSKRVVDQGRELHNVLKLPPHFAFEDEG